MRIELAWPDEALSPNSRPHHIAKWRASKAAKEAAGWATKIVKPRDWDHDGSRLNLTFTAHPKPVARNRDDDNIVASLKSARDGIAAALGIDDSLFDTQPLQWGEPVNGGKIVVVVG